MNQLFGSFWQAGRLALISLIVALAGATSAWGATVAWQIEQDAVGRCSTCVAQTAQTSSASDAETLYERGLAEHQANRPVEAKHYYLLALEKFDLIGVNHAPLLYNLGLLHKADGEYRSALSMFSRALEAYQEALGSNHPYVADATYQLGVVLARLGDHVGAEPFLRKALLLREDASGESHIETGKVARELGLALQELGDLASAEELLRRSVAILEANLNPDDGSLTLSWNELAVVLRARASFDEAEQLYRKSLALQERILGPDHFQIAMTLTDLANTFQDRGDLQTAEALYRRALAISQATFGDAGPITAGILSNLAHTLHGQGLLSEARPLFRRATAIIERDYGPSHPILADHLRNFGVLYVSSGDYGTAIGLLERALGINEATVGADHIDFAMTLNALASAYEGEGDSASAEQVTRRSLVIHEKVLGRGHPRTAAVNNSLADLLIQQSRMEEALHYARQAADAGHAVRRIYLKALFARQLLADEAFAAMQAIGASSAALALQNLAARYAAGSGGLATLVRQEQDDSRALTTLEARLLDELSKLPSDRQAEVEEAIGRRVAVLRTRLSNVRRLLADQFPDYVDLSQSRPAGLQLVQELLSEDEALIVLDIAKAGEGDDYVWSITSDGAVWSKLASSNGDIAAAIVEARQGLDDPHRPGRVPVDPSLLHKLFNVMLGPVVDDIADKKHLLFVLNGPVSSLPPQVLVTSPPGAKTLRDVAWLIRDHTVTVLPAVSSLVLARRKGGADPAPKPIIAYGNPDFGKDCRVAPGELRHDRSIATLPAYGTHFSGMLADVIALRKVLPCLKGTELEVREVARSLGAQSDDVITGAGATEAAIKTASLEQYRVVYFATHGLVAGQVSEFVESGAEPALTFTLPDTATSEDDGLLTASEVALLKLNADWVVLSACNTAESDRVGAEALAGLARAFFYAGARSMLVTHWPVDDAASAALMIGTFRYANEYPGKRGADALRQAMLDLMSDARHSDWSDPAYWAPYVLVGEPNVLR